MLLYIMEVKKRGRNNIRMLVMTLRIVQLVHLFGVDAE